MKFGDDWTGVFLRGDDAAYYALSLQAMLEAPVPENEHSTPVLAKFVLRSLVDVLLASNETGGEIPKAQQLKEFGECLSPTNK